MNDEDSKKTLKLHTLPPSEPPSSRRSNVDEFQDEESSTRDTDAAIPIAAPTPERTRAVVTVVSGPGSGRVFSVAGVAVLGRGKECQVRIDDGGASRTHARITDAGGRYVLEDMGSTNGTFVDGRRIERAELKSGDRIHMGPHIVLSFAILDAQAERITQQLYESSVRDPLTRAFNRRYLVERLASEVAYARRHKTPLGLILMDLDLFKRVNDTYGHLAGDEVLREVSALVQRLIRAEDVFARFGGEEFVLLVRGIEHVNVGRFAERVRAAVERLEVSAAGAKVVIKATISAGYASINEVHGDDREPSFPDRLLRLADERLYLAKSAGRNRVQGAGEGGGAGAGASPPSSHG
jgi:two-component system cell cycle response regulator